MVSDKTPSNPDTDGFSQGIKWYIGFKLFNTVGLADTCHITSMTILYNEVFLSRGRYKEISNFKASNITLRFFLTIYLNYFTQVDEVLFF